MVASEYKIVESAGPEALTDDVSRAMQDGWRPLGGVSVVRFTEEDRKGYTDTAWIYSQAMIRLA